MGTWSRIAGEVFLDWLALPPSLRCLDVGCGNGAFTELLVERCAPTEVQGVDPAAGQLAFARQRHKALVAEFHQGDALALPFAENRFDAAIMALVIFFVPDPAKGIAEMARVVRPGGMVSAYAWDMAGRGSPLDPFQSEINALGHKTMRAPAAAASRLEALHQLWSGAGLEQIETRVIAVQRSFADFEELWTSHSGRIEHRPIFVGDAARRRRTGQAAAAREVSARCRRPYHLWRAGQRGQRPRAGVARTATADLFRGKGGHLPRGTAAPV